MSFITDIVSNVLGGSNSTAGALFNTIISGAALYYLEKSNRDNLSGSTPEATPETVDIRYEFAPNTDNHVPVVYGNAWVTPKVIDVVQGDNGCTMWYALVLCEKTGIVRSTGLDSKITINSAYLNGMRLTVGDSGNVIDAVDEETREVEQFNGEVQIYAYNNGSSNSIRISPAGGDTGYPPAWELMPTWTNKHLMSELVFVIMRINYNSSKSVTGIGSLRFNVSNSCVLPGDCLYDYMTNSRYGAGIKAEEIDV